MSTQTGVGEPAATERTDHRWLLIALAVVVVLSATLLVRQFRDTGDRRALVLVSAYVFSLVVLTGYGAAFPGVLAPVGPLGGWASTAPWLWVSWHTGFPILLAAAVAPWPTSWQAPTATKSRGYATWATALAAAGAGVLVVVAAVTGRAWLPVLIQGTDTSAMTRLVGPFMVPVVAAAAVLAVIGALRLTGPTCASSS